MEPDDIAVAIDFGLRDAFALVRADTALESGAERPPLYLGVYRASARIIVPEGECIAFAAMGEHGRIFLSLTSRYEDRDGFRIPRELRYIVISEAPDVQAAVDYLYGTAHRFHHSMQLTVNASADMLQETLVQEMQDVPPGSFFEGSFFRQTDFTVPRLPRNGRIAAGPLAAAVINASFGLPEKERDRFDRAVEHYCMALGHWREGEIPLAMMHLYIGVESICKAIIRNIKRREGITDDQLVRRYSLEAEKYPDTALLNAIRRYVVFQGDVETAAAARNASDGIEHGFAPWEDVWKLSRDAYIKTAAYLRDALLGMLALDDDATHLLCGRRYGSVLIEEPRYWEHGIFEDDLIKRWKQLDFRIVDTAPFIKEMKIDLDLGSYEFVFDWDNEFNPSKRVIWIKGPAPTSGDAAVTGNDATQ